MRLGLSSISRMVSITGIAALAVAVVPGVASAAPAGGGGNYTCTGTTASPGTLAGNFANVIVAGTCLVDAGNVHISGNLTVAPGASLVADFGQDDITHSGTSNVTVDGNMLVAEGASVLFGCYPLQVSLWSEGPPIGLVTTPDFPCDDDPNAFEANGTSAPTLSATEYIGGNLISFAPLGVVVHNTTVRGNVIDYGGGGGTSGNPEGIFAQYIPSGPPAAPGQLDTEPYPLPPYFDYTNVNVGGNLTLTGAVVDWYGMIRDTVHGSLTDTDNTSTTDANETVTDTIYGNMVCSGNNPQVEFGDSNGLPDKVGGVATGECGFNVLIPNPSPASVPGLSSYPLEHITVHLY
jgi:hypothetical protein